MGVLKQHLPGVSSFVSVMDLSTVASNGTFKQRTGGAVLLKGESVGILIGACLGVIFFVLLTLFVVVLKRRRNCSNRSLISEKDPTSIGGIKSSPPSGCCSPQMKTVKSCPSFHRSMISSSSSVNTPDFILPPERVQPPVQWDSSGNHSSYDYQQQLLGSFRPELYSSLDHEEHTLPDSPFGRIWFSVVYDVVIESLTVSLVKMKGLHGRSLRNFKRDPFVKIYLLPDERTCKTSATRKKTLCPVYNETFKFQVPSIDVKDRLLKFSVYDIDKRRVRHCLGHAVIPLAELDITGKMDVVWRDLEENGSLITCGELKISTTYQPKNDKIAISVSSLRHARHLDVVADKGIFVKVQLIYNRKTVKSKRTLTRQASQNTTFGESFSFSLSGKLLESCYFTFAIVSVRLKGPLIQEKECGQFSIGSFMFTRGAGLRHWQEMLARPDTVITQWHNFSKPLLPNKCRRLSLNKM